MMRRITRRVRAEDRWRIYSDNIAMARWLQSQLPVLLALRSDECCT